MSRVDAQTLSRAREAAATIAPMAPEIERGRRLPPAALDALVGAGVFKLMVPRALGGGEASVSTVLAVIEAIARADGSAGWCAMIGSTSGLMAAFLPDDVAREVYEPEGAITGGVFAPMGVARRVEGGYQVRGRWPFASGSQHCSHVMGGAMIAGAERPEMRSVLFRADEIRILDTWDTGGLRGTGSHDFEAEDVLVPEGRAFSLLGAPRRSETLYRQPFFGTLAAGVASVSLGIARGALDALIALATTKAAGPGSKKTIAHRELVQLHVARAEGIVGAARAQLVESVEAIADEVAREGSASIRSRAQVRLAACHAASESARTVDLAYEAGGGSAIYASSPLQRCFRDAHTATAHEMVSATSATMVGRVLLGLDVDTTTL